jgi:hypothetical protein
VSDQGEFNRGYFGGQRDNDASRAGANAALWDQQAQERREASRRAAEPPQSSQPLLAPEMIGTLSAGTHAGSAGAPATLFGAVKGGALVGVALFLLVVFFGGAPWAAPQVLASGLTWVLVGALAGGAIYVGLIVLGVALRVVGWLLVAGIALHLFGAIDLFAVIGRLIRTL